MKNRYLTLLIETGIAALFCGLFGVVAGVLMSWYYWHQATGVGEFSALPSQYLLLSLAISTVSVFVPLLIFNVAKMKYSQRKVKRGRP